MQQSTGTLTSQDEQLNTELIELPTTQDKCPAEGDETSEHTSNSISLLLSPNKSSRVTNSATIKDAVSTALSQFDLKEVLVPKKPNQADVEKKAAISKHIKRPMNAFMVWAQAARRALSKTHPTLHNAQLSKTLGNMWHQLKEDQKLPFMDEANRLRDEHKNENPGYKYQPKRRPKMAFLSQTIASTISQNANPSTNTDSKLDIKINNNNTNNHSTSLSNSISNHVIIDSKFKHKYRKGLNKMENSQKSNHGINNNENSNQTTKTEMNVEKDEYSNVTKKIKFNPSSQYALNKINKQPPPPQPQSSMLTLNHNHHNTYGNNSTTNNNHFHHVHNMSQQQDVNNRLSSNQSQAQSNFNNTALNLTNNSNNMSSLNEDTNDTSGGGTTGGGGAGYKILSEFKLNNSNPYHHHHHHSHLYHNQALTPPLSSSSSATTTANSSFQFPNEHVLYPNYTSSTSSSPTSNHYTQSQMSHLFQYQYANNGSYLSNNSSSSSSSLSSQTNAYNQMNRGAKKLKVENGQSIVMNSQQQQHRNNGDHSDNENDNDVEENDEDDEDEEDYNLLNEIKSNPIISQVNNQTLEDISDEDLEENDAYNRDIHTNGESDANNRQLDELGNIPNVNDSNLVLGNSTSPPSQLQPQHEPLSSITQFYLNSRFTSPYGSSNSASNQTLNSYPNTHMFGNSSLNDQGNSHYDRYHSYSTYQSQLTNGSANSSSNGAANNLQQSAFDAYQQIAPLQPSVEAHMTFSAFKQTHQYLHQIEAQQQAYSSPNFIFQLQQAATNANDSSINSSTSNNGGKRSASNSPSLLINQSFDQSNKITSHSHHSRSNTSSLSNSPIDNQFRLIENIENTDERQLANNNLTSTQSTKTNGSNAASTFSTSLLTSSNYTDTNQIKHSSFVPFTSNYV